MDEVRVRASVTPDQVRRVLLGQPQARMVFIGLGLLAAVLVARATLDSLAGGAYVLVSLLVGGLAAWWLIRRSLRLRAGQWTRDAEWLITPSDVTTTTPDSTSTVRWSLFRDLFPVADAVALRTRGGGMMIIPRDAVTAEQLALVAGWARAAGVTVRGL